MKIRATIAFAAKTPLEIVELELDRLRAGEMLVEITATGIVREVGAGVTGVAVDVYLIPFDAPECRSPPHSSWSFVTTPPASNPMVRH